MRNLFKTIALFAVTAVCAGFAACSDDDGDEPTPGPQRVAIGGYTFDGTEHDICYGVYEANDSYYNFLFTPTAQGETHHTVIMLSVGRYFEGQTIDVTEREANFDYIFSYDDPFFYYAPEFALKGGTISVKDDGDGKFTVKMENIVLPDSRVFSLSFEGTLPDARVTEQ